MRFYCKEVQGWECQTYCICYWWFGSEYC